MIWLGGPKRRKSQTFVRRLALVKWAGAIVSLVGAIAISPIPTDHLIGVILLCATLLLGSRAVVTPGGYLFTTFPVPVLIAASVPQVGAWWAAAALIFDTSICTGRSAHSRLEFFLRSSVAILICSIASKSALSTLGNSPGDVGLAASISFLLASLTFLFLRSFTSEKIASEEDEDRLLRLRSEQALKPLRFGQFLAGAFPLFLALQEHLWLLLMAFMPFMTLFELSAENIIFRIKSEQAEKALQEMEQTRAERLETKRALDQSDQELRILEQLTSALRDIKSESDGVSRLISFVIELLPDASVAFFPLLKHEDRSVLGQPVGGGRLQASEISSLASLARMSNRDGRLLHRSRPDQRKFVLAAPVIGYGVFCALRVRDAYTESEAHLFEVICRKGRDLLGAAQQREKERGQQLKLMSQVELLDVLSRTGRQLFDAKNRGEILQLFIAGLERLVPHSFGVLRCREWVVSWRQDLSPKHVRPDSFEGKLALSLRLPNDKDLSARYLSTKFFQEHRMNDFHSGLLVTISFEDQRQGEFLLLASESPKGYAQEHRDLLSTLIGQMMSALLKSERLEALQMALQELAEKQSQLIQSSKMTALGTMVAGVAHEINTPLGAISLSVEAAQMQVEKKPEAALNKLTVALEAADKIRKLVDRLLMFSRKSGNEHNASMASTEHTEQVDLAEVIVESEALTIAELRQRGVRLEINATSCFVLGTSSELTQVLINLVMNAAATTVDRHPDVSNRPPVYLNCGPVLDTPNTEVFLEIADSGMGMDEATQTRIFEPFFTTKPVGVGTGLGLSIAHEIVAAHGGRIQIESKVGQGTTFRLTFPAFKAKS